MSNVYCFFLFYSLYAWPRWALYEFVSSICAMHIYICVCVRLFHDFRSQSTHPYKLLRFSKCPSTLQEAQNDYSCHLASVWLLVRNSKVHQNHRNRTWEFDWQPQSLSTHIEDQEQNKKNAKFEFVRRKRCAALANLCLLSVVCLQIVKILNSMRAFQ